MAELKVPVVQIDEIKPHPDPDATKIELAIVGGWQTVVPKGKHKIGDIVLYVPVDAVIPQHISDMWGVTKYLSNGRVRAAKLRGAISYGFIVQLEYIDPISKVPPQLGEDLANTFGITKYEPPITYAEGNFEADHPLFHKYTNIEQFQNYPDALQEGEEVVITEKIHGTNARVGLVSDEDDLFLIGSHNRQVKQGQNSKYEFPLYMSCVTDLLDSGWATKSVILFGEIYGSGVQNPTTYGLANGEIEFRAFDISLDGQYVHWTEFQRVCHRYSVPTVPALYVGPFDPDLLSKISGGKTVVSGDHMREGVVVKPTTERRDPAIGRVVLKRVSDDWQLRKEQVTDSH